MIVEHLQHPLICTHKDIFYSELRISELRNPFNDSFRVVPVLCAALVKCSVAYISYSNEHQKHHVAE